MVDQVCTHCISFRCSQCNTNDRSSPLWWTNLAPTAFNFGVANVVQMLDPAFCLGLYVYVCLSQYVGICLTVSVCVWCLCVSVCMYVGLYGCLCISLCRYVVCWHVCMSLPVCLVCLSVCMCVCLCMYAVFVNMYV